MESTAIPTPSESTAPRATPSSGDKGLKKNAIGFASSVVIGVASTAPGYSLAATLGFIAAAVALQSPAILLISFVPMFLVAAGYYYMNKADPDCGTSFSWVTKAMGPQLGWIAGWTIVVADVIVMANLAQIAGLYTFLLVGWDSAAASTVAVTAVGVVWIALMTAIVLIGIELSARTQIGLLAAEIVTLAAFAIVALVKVYAGDAHPDSIDPSLSWLNPFGLSPSELSAGMLLAVFIYWGWDTTATVNEETENPDEAPGRATVVSTLILLGIYIIVAVAAQAYAGVDQLIANQEDVLSALGTEVFGTPLDKILIIAVLTSAAASTQTTILPTARTTLSMAAHKAMPRALSKIDRRFLTPTWSTWWFGIASVVWWVVLISIDRSENILWDSISGLGLAIAFYYGLTALAAPILFRRQLLRSLRTFVLVGIVPLLGFATLAWVFVKSAIDMWDPANSYTPAWFAFGNSKGVGAAFVIGIGMLVLGIPLVIWARFVYRDFFGRKPEAAESLTDLLPDEFRVTEEPVVSLPETTSYEPPAVPRPRVRDDGGSEVER